MMPPLTILTPTFDPPSLTSTTEPFHTCKRETTVLLSGTWRELWNGWKTPRCGIIPTPTTTIITMRQFLSLALFVAAATADAGKKRPYNTAHKHRDLSK